MNGIIVGAVPLRLSCSRALVYIALVYNRVVFGFIW